MFAIEPLNLVEWKAVLYLSAPVVLIDEVLKFISVRPLRAPSITLARLHRADACLQATFISPPSKVKVD